MFNIINLFNFFFYKRFITIKIIDSNFYFYNFLKLFTFDNFLFFIILLFYNIKGVFIQFINYLKNNTKLYYSLPYVLLISFIFFYISAFYLKIFFFIFILNSWIFFYFLVFILLNGFSYFTKKLYFSKITNINYMFWKRSFNLFWLIESGVFLSFIYLTINASNEVLFFYDQNFLVKTYFFFTTFFFYKLMLLNLVIFLTNFFIFNLTSIVFEFSILYFSLISLFLLIIFLIEFFQFFYFLNVFNLSNFFFLNENYFFIRDLELRRARIVNNYIAICVFAKFWHLFFILAFWIFSVNAVSNEEDVKTDLFSLNLQNFLILYIMNWINVYPFFKFFFRKYLSYSYFWVNFNFKENLFFYFIKVNYYMITSLIFF